MKGFTRRSREVAKDFLAERLIVLVYGGDPSQLLKRSKSMSEKIVLTVRRRTKVDGMSGIQTTVEILADLMIGMTRSEVKFFVPPEKYDQYAPSTRWESELVHKAEV